MTGLTQLKKRGVVATACAGVALTLALDMPAARAQRGCASDRPCITQDYQQGRALVFGWTGGWDAYNVRWSRPGRGETQSETRGRTFRIRNVHAGVRYRFKVQGCTKRFLASSRCSPWAEISVTAS